MLCIAADGLMRTRDDYELEPTAPVRVPFGAHSVGLDEFIRTHIHHIVSHKIVSQP